MHGRSWRRAKAQGDEVMWYWLFYSANNYSRPHKIQTLFLFNISTANKEVLPSNKGHPFTLVYTWYPLSLGTLSTWHLGTLGTLGTESHLALSHTWHWVTWHWVTWHSVHCALGLLGTRSHSALGHSWHLVTLGTRSIWHSVKRSDGSTVPHTKSNVKVWIHEK